jgi:hypothetical protein
MTVHFEPDETWYIASVEGEHYPQYGSVEDGDEQDDSG